jgi:peroxiredoxin
MGLAHTPLVETGHTALDFDLPGVDGRNWTLADCRGDIGTLVMFICNHCPYVKAVQERLLADCRTLGGLGIGCVAIMSNDTDEYPEDSFSNMQQISAEFEYPFPYLLDHTQEIAKAYGAVCTPDFFGYNASLELQYRGRLDGAGASSDHDGLRRDLVEAMKQIASTGRGPANQYASMGCSIKWRDG